MANYERRDSIASYPAEDSSAPPPYPVYGRGYSSASGGQQEQQQSASSSSCYSDMAYVLQVVFALIVNEFLMCIELVKSRLLCVYALRLKSLSIYPAARQPVHLDDNDRVYRRRLYEGGKRPIAAVLRQQRPHRRQPALLLLCLPPSAIGG